MPTGIEQAAAYREASALIRQMRDPRLLCQSALRAILDCNSSAFGGALMHLRHNGYEGAANALAAMWCQMIRAL